MKRSHLIKALLVIAVLVVLAAGPLMFGPYEQQLGYRTLQLIALAAAWNLLAGYTGLVSLGSAAFIGLGAYSATAVSNDLGLPVPMLLVVGALAGAGFAVLVSPAMFRLSGLYFTVGTLALASALQILMLNVSQFGGASGLILETTSPETYALYWLALVLAVISVGAVGVVMATPASLALRAIRDDEATAKEVGVVTFRTKLWAFALAGALMGSVGALQGIKLAVIEPNGSFGLNWTILILSAVIIGGVGTQMGPIVGAVFSIALAESLKDYPEVHIAISGLVLIIIIRVAPSGLWGLAQSKFRRRQQTSDMPEKEFAHAAL